jgi:hypothetical protein
LLKLSAGPSDDQPENCPCPAGPASKLALATRFGWARAVPSVKPSVHARVEINALVLRGALLFMAPSFLREAITSPHPADLRLAL